MRKTYRMYLFSYLCILLLPILILSMVIFSMLGQYTAQQVTGRSHTVQEQLSMQLGMYTAEMDAYALQTTRRSAYSSRHIRETANFFSIQQDLNEWIVTNPMVENMYFYTTIDDRFYASGAVYNRSFFMQRFFPSVQDFLTKDRSFWLRTEDALYYVAVARLGTVRRHFLICQLDRSALNEIVNRAGMSEDCSTYLCLDDGTILFEYEPVHSYDDATIARMVQEQNDGGSCRADGIKVLYAFQQGMRSLPCVLSLTPYGTAFSKIYALQTMFVVALCLIGILGTALIAWIMDINYKPLAQLETMAADMTGNSTTGDALRTVQNALEKLHDDVRSGTALRKEQVILKLLLGSYSSDAEYRQEASAAGIAWQGGPCRLVLVRHAMGRLDENTEETVTTLLLPLFEYRPLYLTIPESGMMVFIAPGEMQDITILQQEVQQLEMIPAVAMGDLCRNVTEIAASYQKMQSRPDDIDQSLSEAHEAVVNAAAFGERQRLLLALDALCANIPDSISDAKLVCCDVFHHLQRLLERTGSAHAADVIRSILLPGIFSATERRDVMSLFERARAMMANEINSQGEEKANDELTEHILSYLAEKYRDDDLSVSSVAEHFGISVSNLSHYFKNHLGISVSEAIERLRMDEACRLLLTEKTAVSVIASRVGYAQPATFMRAFKKNYAMTPTEFRVQNGR